MCRGWIHEHQQEYGVKNKQQGVRDTEILILQLEDFSLCIAVTVSLFEMFGMPNTSNFLCWLSFQMTELACKEKIFSHLLCP